MVWIFVVLLSLECVALAIGVRSLSDRIYELELAKTNLTADLRQFSDGLRVVSNSLDATDGWLDISYGGTGDNSLNGYFDRRLAEFCDSRGIDRLVEFEVRVGEGR